MYKKLAMLIIEVTCWYRVCNTLSVLQVVVGYQVPKTYHLASPLRSRSVKRLARGSYRIVMKDFAMSVLHQRIMASELARSAKKQMKSLSGKKESSMVFGKKEFMTDFTWNMLWDELAKEVPILMFFLKKMVKNADSRKPMVCLIISMLLKDQNKEMCLLQNVISALLYGNGCAKQVSLLLEILDIQLCRYLLCMVNHSDHQILCMNESYTFTHSCVNCLSSLCMHELFALIHYCK